MIMVPTDNQVRQHFLKLKDHLEQVVYSLIQTECRDTIVAGGDSVDQMWGGEGRDTFQLTRGRGVAYINDFQDGLDHITCSMQLV
ncbi:hypothetical protein RS9916_27664 [Synechococcus sp. RS9916]|nr:hypothetical protein RS9916_27664 [Synechococcus sp. RS9916]